MAEATSGPVSAIATELSRPRRVELFFDVASPGRLGVVEDSCPGDMTGPRTFSENCVLDGSAYPLGDGKTLTFGFVLHELGQRVGKRDSCAFNICLIAYSAGTAALVELSGSFRKCR